MVFRLNSLARYLLNVRRDAYAFVTIGTPDICKVMGKELRENAPAARESEGAGIT